MGLDVEWSVSVLLGQRHYWRVRGLTETEVEMFESDEMSISLVQASPAIVSY